MELLQRWSYKFTTDNYNTDPITNFASFKYKTSIIGKTPNNDNDDNNTKDAELVVTSKYLSSFWNATFKITDTKLYVPVFTWSTQDYNKLLEQLKTGFKITIKWNNYISEMSNQNNNNNSDYLIDPTFTKVSTWFVLSWKMNMIEYHIIQQVAAMWLESTTT